eukprot:TRINITY_DN2783_c1_g2_i10.p1 TRINITY_DN2783_c1_g2~~TRINITY_DN2783_c1_g2_i10.p1  ORF type:complete len:363 (-),score=78.85 TRINITY_DN2783_c1_g2_i10:289-1293(-)
MPPATLTNVGGPFLTFVSGIWSYHSCVITAARSLRCWGWNGYGQLGVGSTAAIGDNPGEMPPAPVSLPANVNTAVTGDLFTCALLVNGAVYCWGDNSAGQLGFGSITRLLAPGAAANLTIYSVSSLAAGYLHICLISTSGQVACWGSGGYGQLGIGNTTNIGDAPGEMPPTAVALGGTALQVSCGQYFTCALLSSKQVKCWGYNLYGQLGQSTTTDALSPVTVSLSQTPISLTLLSYSACALDETGAMTCWGSNDFGQLGIGSTAQLNYSLSSTLALGPSPVHSAFPSHLCTLLMAISNAGARTASDSKESGAKCSLVTTLVKCRRKVQFLRQF